jgi:hypothetical protein
VDWNNHEQIADLPDGWKRIVGTWNQPELWQRIETERFQWSLDPTLA